MDCRRKAGELGWEVAEVYCDNSLSAHSRRKVRPRYQAMMEALRNGSRDAVIVYEVDRLYRQPP